ncbi:MAG: class D beta-lactamase [Ignavibacteriaceae bacterium]|nr:class D beta-lactamase [Ignavibacteriaceae bacterium]
MQKKLIALLFLLQLPILAQASLAGEWHLAKQYIYNRDGSIDSVSDDGIDFFRKIGDMPDLLKISDDRKFTMHFRDTLFNERLVYKGAILLKGIEGVMQFELPLGNPAVKMLSPGALMISRDYDPVQTTLRRVEKIFHKTDIREGFRKFFDDEKLDGTILIYNEKEKRYIVFNPDRTRNGYIPASTFKIFNSMAGITYGAVKDENEIIKWDGVKRSREELNKDLDMREAFKISSVWFYQEIARRIGAENMQKALAENRYGNRNMNGGLERFWLDGEIRISPEQQVDFLRRMYFFKLSFSPESVRITKSIMLLKDEGTYKLYGKTGWMDSHGIDLGWLVGFVETEDNIYFYALNVESPEGTVKNFLTARRAIVDRVFETLLKR